MGFLKKLFGLEEPAPTRSIRSEPADPIASSAHPYDTIHNAIESWDRNDCARAEALFKKGIDQYRQHEPDGLDFALGRYGAFLRSNGRGDEAKAVLEQAIDLGTDIPAIWSDYADINLEQKDLEGFWSAVECWAKSEGAPLLPDYTDMLLFSARKADRNGNPDLAEAIAQRVYDLARTLDHGESRWAAAGDLGHIIERAGRLEAAMTLWANEFSEGSTDPKTADRLSMHLDRKKECEQAIQVIQQALTRGMPANVEERLRKRLNRSQSKLTGVKAIKTVQAFSIRKGEGHLTLAFQTRVRPPVREVAILGDLARCYGVSKGVGKITDINLRTGEEVRHTPGLPKFTELQFPTANCGLGVQRTGAIGKGESRLAFLDADGRVVNETTVPDATSQLAFDEGNWYVGCRDGNLYAFGSDGTVRWTWATPGADAQSEDSYSRPCPYYVDAAGGMIAIASMETIYTIDARGHTQWQRSLPHENQTKYTQTIPLGGELGRDDAYRTLGLTTGASPDQVKSAYRAAAKRSHPDHNQTDPTAADRFRAVQAAYERLLAGPVEDGPSISFTISIVGAGPTASFINAVPGGVSVGSSHGSVFLFDWKGNQRQARKLGTSYVHALSKTDGSLAAVWCEGLLSILNENNVTNVIEVERAPRHLALFGNGLLLAQRNRAELLDANGVSLWVSEFSKQITAVAGADDRLVCAAGVVTAFQAAR